VRSKEQISGKDKGRNKIKQEKDRDMRRRKGITKYLKLLEN
jgi:hypothetical protein